jgi:transcriptional regulator with XRE-family HTH domain
MTEADKRLAAEIRYLRQKRGFSQSDMADALGISLPQFQKYELADNRITAGRLVEIAAFLSTSPNNLLGWERGETVRGREDNKKIRSQNKLTDLWDSIESDKLKNAVLYLKVD